MVAAADSVVFGDGVQLLRGSGNVVQLRQDAVALAQQMLGAVSVGAGGFGYRQIVGERGEQGVGGLLVGGGDKHEFGLGAGCAVANQRSWRAGCRRR